MTGNEKKLLFILSTICLFSQTIAKLTDYVPVCRAKDPKLEECILRSAQKFVNKLKSGIPEYDLPPIDPMMVPIVDFRKAGMGLTLVIKNSTHTGVGNLIFKRAIVKPENYEFEFRTVLPLHTIKGTYTVNGRIMMLPIMGEGATTITLHDVKGIWKIKGEPVTKNGVKYMKVIDNSVAVEPSLLQVNFENLFNGNKMLGNVLNEVLNAQWKDLYEYVKPALDKSHSEILASFAEKFFSKVPYSEIFLFK